MRWRRIKQRVQSWIMVLKKKRNKQNLISFQFKIQNTQDNIRVVALGKQRVTGRSNNS